MRKILLVGILLTVSTAYSQNGWQSLSIPGGSGFHFGDVNTGILVGSATQYHRTTNGGLNWSTFPVPDTSSNTLFSNAYFYNSNTGWIIGAYTATPVPGGFIYKTTDGGLTWGNMVSVYPVNDIQFVNSSTGYIASGDFPFLGSAGYLYKSTNGGVSWNTLISDDNFYKDLSFINTSTGWVYCYYSDDVGTFVHKILHTTDGGDNWSEVLIDSANGSFSPHGGLQFFGTDAGYLLKTSFTGTMLCKSTNGGSVWIPLDTNTFSGNWIRNFFFLNRDTGWATTGPTGKIFRTNNGGLNWIVQNTGQGNVLGGIYFINGLTGWAMANNNVLLKTTTGGVTGILNISSEILKSYLLHQNYPNPFNPVTRIRFEIPSGVSGERSEVRLSVYDIAGREISELVNGELQPGVYEYEYDGAGLGSGVYFYKLQSGEFSETRRMVLVK